jgi:hypothetical protein
VNIISYAKTLKSDLNSTKKRQNVCRLFKTIRNVLYLLLKMVNKTGNYAKITNPQIYTQIKDKNDKI